MIAISLNFERLIKLFLPPFLRRTKRINFLYACLSPLEGLNQNELYDMVESARELLNHTSEVGVLTNLLNDRFDSVLRRISIGDSTAPVLPPFVHFQSEGQTPDYDYFNDGNPAVYERFRSEYSTNVSFIVYVPASFSSNQLQLVRGIVDQHKLAGKTYKIELL